MPNAKDEDDLATLHERLQAARMLYARPTTSAMPWPKRLRPLRRSARALTRNY
jgi:hypothetical protein